MKKIAIVLRVFLLVTFLLSACSQTAAPSPAPTNTITARVAALTSTPQPSATPAPTQTSAPTLTSTATPVPTPRGGSFPKIVHFFQPRDAADPAGQGVYLRDGAAETAPVAILSVPEISGWFPLLKFSPDGKAVLVAPNHYKNEPAAKTKNLDVIDLTSGAVRHLMPIAGNVYVEAISWSPDGNWALMQYYYFGSTVHNIDVINTTSGAKTSFAQVLFEDWLPDSSGFLYHKTQVERIFVFDVKQRESRPYLTIPSGRIFNKTKSDWILLKVLPEIDALLMNTKDGLVLIPHISQLTEPTYWDIKAVLESAVNLGKIPDGILYFQANAAYRVAPDQKQIFISGVPYQGARFTHIYHVDGSLAPLNFSGIEGVAWAPDSSSFLGIQQTFQTNYVIQPSSAGAAGAVFYEVRPIYVLALNTQDVFWKREGHP